MKKISAFLLIVFFMSMCVSACTPQITKSNIIKAKRRFAEYVEPQQTTKGNVIDLSEGPKQRYDMIFGPQNLNFNIKIVDPY